MGLHDMLRFFVVHSGRICTGHGGWGYINKVTCETIALTIVGYWWLLVRVTATLSCRQC